MSAQKAHICPCGDHAWLRMQRGVTLVDPGDSALLDGNGWSVNGDGYAKGKKLGTLHRRVMAAPDGLHVDHINHDKLDNRKPNLRLCTNAEGLRNRGMAKKGGRTLSRYKGVTWQNGKWVARIAIDGRRIYLGCFTSEADAAQAYNYGAALHHGEFARPNAIGG